MKKLFKFFAGLALVLGAVSAVFYLFKTKCPFGTCTVGDDEPGEEEECDLEEEKEEKKSAPHSRGYFNLNSIREAEERTEENLNQ